MKKWWVARVKIWWTRKIGKGPGIPYFSWEFTLECFCVNERIERTLETFLFNAEPRKNDGSIQQIQSSLLFSEQKSQTVLSMLAFRWRVFGYCYCYFIDVCQIQTIAACVVLIIGMNHIHSIYQSICQYFCSLKRKQENDNEGEQSLRVNCTQRKVGIQW